MYVCRTVYEVGNFFAVNKSWGEHFFVYPVLQPGDFEGFGQLFVVSDEQKLDWGDMFTLLTLPTNLRKPHLFLKLPLPLRSHLSRSLC
jgi:hypothetical protein